MCVPLLLRKLSQNTICCPVFLSALNSIFKAIDPQGLLKLQTQLKRED